MSFLYLEDRDRKCLFFLNFPSMMIYAVSVFESYYIYAHRRDNLYANTLFTRSCSILRITP